MTVKRSTISLIAGAVAVPMMATSVAAVTPDQHTLPQTFPAAAAATAAPSMQVAGNTDFTAAAKWAKKDQVREAKRAARANGIRTYGTAFTAKEAAARLVSWARSGMGGYHNQCLRLADDAYGATGGRTTTALAQWSRAQSAGVAHPGSTDIPVGAQMFWRTSHPAGHIAVYVGNGKVVTNVPGGAVEIANWKELNEWGPYLGWANPYYG
jgi:hypothetical protein